MRFNFLFKKKQLEKSQITNDLTYSDLSDYELELYEFVRPYTMTSKERIVSLIRSIQYVIDNNIKGDFVECGVWKGGSSMVVAKILKDRAIEDRKIYLYDTFDGMVAPDDVDKTFDGKSAEILMKDEAKENSLVWAFSPEDEVRSNFSKTGINSNQVKFIKGDVCQTLLKEIPKEISLLRLDTDWYESTKIEMEILFPIVSDYGIVLIDDYGHWEGCKKAIDEYLRKTEKSYFLNRIDYTGRLIIKH